MKVKQDSTRAKAARPSVNGKRVSIFVPDDHRVMRLKRALDWEAIKTVMIKHWRKAGKNVDGGPGLPWPSELYAPLLVLMSVKTLDSRQMERDLEENAVSRWFVGLEDELSPHVRDHSNIARAQDALGVEGWREVNESIVGQATLIIATGELGALPLITGGFQFTPNGLARELSLTKHADGQRQDGTTPTRSAPAKEPRRLFDQRS